LRRSMGKVGEARVLPSDKAPDQADNDIRAEKTGSENNFF
jgi:hypothetical protein